MGSVVDTNAMSGFLKHQFAEKLKWLIPNQCKLQHMMGFNGELQQVGLQYHQPVVVQMEQGVTYAGPDAGAFSLQAAASGVTKDAQVTSYQIALRSQISYELAARASSDKTAFGNATRTVTKSMIETMRKRQEIEYMWGNKGLGTYASAAGAVLTITTAEWAPGIWLGSEGALLEVRSSAGVVRGTCTVVSVNLTNRTVTVDAAPAGITSGDVFWFATQYGNTMNGVHKILSNAGTMFNISAATYTLWAGATFGFGSAAASYTKVQGLVKAAVDKGLDTDATILINTGAWLNLVNTELSGSRRYLSGDVGTNKTVQGTEELEIYDQNGANKLVAYAFEKEGYCHLLAGTKGNTDWERIGATDTTFQMPGAPDGEFFRQMSDAAGYELRGYSNTAVFSSAPAKSAYGTSIVNA